MSKKSYKRNQNRLYREIKRRIIAERQLIKPVQLIAYPRQIDTIKIKKITYDYAMGTETFIKHELGRQITEKLISDGYILFSCYEGPNYMPIENAMTIEARLDVVRPGDLPQLSNKEQSNLKDWQKEIMFSEGHIW